MVPGPSLSGARATGAREKIGPHTLTSLALCAALAEGVRLRLVVLDRQPLLVVVKGRGGQGGGGGGGFGAASRSRLGGGPAVAAAAASAAAAAAG